ncbi:MAG TPA: RHS repeat-associated core domain-containing protein, partial [Pyrinomonadaceae bacterium]|nr:RHS repeat-associated core domain-containing protein [Pyrinomonadaceae bacterium]
HRTRVHQIFDGAGVVTNIAYDFKGNVLESRRDLLTNYKQAVDWLQNPLANDGSFTSRTTHDALNRPITITTPDQSVYSPTFNEANLLDKVGVKLRGAAANTAFVSGIDYNAKGQRTFIQYANGAATTYEYDKQTFRLVHLKTTRAPGQNGIASQIFKNGSVVQDLHYTYDPVGNITRIFDDALLVVANNNQSVSPVCDYTYDAVYRLCEATGREHVSQTVFAFNPPSGNFRDYPFTGHVPNANDLQALRNYTERYEYDAVGNLAKLAHEAANGSWTRTCEYKEASLLEATKQSNRLSSSVIGQLPAETYSYDVHGNMTKMPHLTLMQWDFRDRLQATASQAVNNGTPETTFYVYDAVGERARKVTERQNGTRKNERIYLGGFEVYREYNGVAQGATLERQTLHVMDDKERVALVETKTIENGNAVNTPVPQQSFQFGNHLGSSSLELDQNGSLISYEEYHPYGSTSYQARSSAAEVSLKRYRYSGKERDEETGLNYHGARYCAPWLARWTSVDPVVPTDGVNGYVYARNNPITRIDRDGRQSEDVKKEPDPTPPAEPKKTEAPEYEEPSPPARRSKDEDDEPGVLRTIFNHTIGRIFDAVRTLFEGVGLAVKRLFQPIFELREDGVAKGLIGAVGTLVSTALIAVGTLLFLEPISRPLTKKEVELTRSAFGNSIALTHVRAKEGFSLHTLFVGRTHVMNYQIFDLPKDSSERVFLHEMTHIWQEQHGNPMIPELENDSYEWEEAVINGTPWEKLGPEQQAEVLQRAYRFERELKHWEELKREYATKPPLPKEIEKIHGPRRLPDRPIFLAGNLFVGLHDVSDYMLDALRKVRAGEGAGI